MSDTIAYDLPLVDLIAELNATNHVTHTTFTKTSVTLHHNAGVNTFQDVLNTWKTQQSSAHFDVDAEGNVCQFVKATEYAWAVGSHEGNCDTISIEQCNSDIGGNWPISETTWHAACRLAAWLHIHVIGHRPTKDSLLPHKFWSPTACPGPYLLGIWSEVLSYCQSQYDEIVSGHTGTPVKSPVPPAEIPLEVDGELGTKTITRWQQVMRTPVDGVISATNSSLVKAVQTELNTKDNAGLKVDGEGIAQNGQKTLTAQALQKYLGTTQDGIISTPVSDVVKAVQIRLNTGSF